MSRSVGVVVPAFRPDVGTLRRYLAALDDALAPAALRVELDDPRPGTHEALADAPATVHAVDARRGKGAAITCGFEHLDTDVLAFADADGSTPADSVANVVEPVATGQADLSVGSRRHPNAVVRSHQTLARRRLGDGFAWFARRLLDVPLYDYQCGAKALTRETWAAVREHLYEAGFAWDVELVAMAGALGRRVVEIPVVWEDQPDSTVSPVSTAAELGRALVLSRHRARCVQGSAVHGALAGEWSRGPRLIDRLGHVE